MEILGLIEEGIRQIRTDVLEISAVPGQIHEIYAAEDFSQRPILQAVHAVGHGFEDAEDAFCIQFRLNPAAAR